MAEATAYVRTQVRTTNPEKGTYRTLDGSFEIRAASDKKGEWDLYRREGDSWVLVQAHAGKYDAALTRILAEDGVTVERLNTRPPKPKAEKPKAEPKVESSESDRRSGATGTAPSGQPKAGRPSVKRSARKVA